MSDDGPRQDKMNILGGKRKDSVGVDMELFADGADVDATLSFDEQSIPVGNNEMM